ncbi:hypothetical protein [Allocoleopsis franciscana]|uniref:hypothetical protein n=1 Tax=Allocoleopsis franciscana TaxID=2886352 RepID=UPI0005A1E477|nr:hypothetical protein [Allocoleopsis franciscana]
MKRMDKDAEKTVQLRVDIPDALRTRLKTQAVRRGVTMGELLQELIEKPLRHLEIEALEEAKTK